MTHTPTPGPRGHGAPAPVEAPGLPAEEGVDLADAEEQAAEAPEEKRNRTDGADGT